MDFIVKYWAQLAVVITAIGYSLKGFWDFRVKKLEIKYTMLFKERLQSISKFFLLFKKNESATIELIHEVLDSPNGHNDKYDKVIKDYKEFEKAYYYVTLLVPPKQRKDFDALDFILIDLQTLYFECIKKKPDLHSINENLNDKQIESSVHLDNIRSYLQKEFKVK